MNADQSAGRTPESAEKSVRADRDRVSKALAGSATAVRRRRLPLWAKICLALGLVLLLFAGGIMVGGWALAQRYDNNVKRADLLGSSRHDGRQLGKVNGPLNILLVGSDSRETEEFNPDDPSSAQASVPGERGDAMMVLHVAKDMKRGYVISFPRDSYVDIPASDDGETGGVKSKINAAYAWGGAPLAVKTVEQFTGLTMDHVVVVNFGAVRAITDAVGGVDVTIDKEVTDPRSKRHFHAGINHLDGAAAEDYIRQRYDLPGGDFDRVHRQQQFLAALLAKVTRTNWLTNPAKFDKLMMTVTDAITVDKATPVRELAMALRDIHGKAVTYITMPHSGIGTEAAGSVIYPDETKTAELFTAIKNDTMANYLRQNPTANDTTHGN